MKPRLLICCAFIWCVAVGAGILLMSRYESSAGASGTAPVEWPAASRLRHTPARQTLVMFAHPKCACTRASLAELASIMAENPGRLNAHVLFLKPAAADAAWTRPILWGVAAEIPGVTVSSDDTGAEAARFGSQTSGDVLMYDAQGRLTFHGGITAARGRMGPSLGQNALGALLAGNRAAQSTAPVFGCPLTTPQSPSH